MSNTVEIRDHLHDAFVEGFSTPFDPSVHELVEPHHSIHFFLDRIQTLCRQLGYPLWDHLILFADHYRGCLTLALWEGQPPRPDGPTAVQVIKAWTTPPKMDSADVYMAARLVEPAWSRAKVVQAQIQQAREEKAQRKVDRYEDRKPFLDYHKHKGNHAMVKKILGSHWLLEDET